MPKPTTNSPSDPAALGAAGVSEATPAADHAERRLAGDRTERRLVGAMIVLALFLTSFSALLGYAIVPPGMRFVGTAYNIDDYNVYLSWLRQTTDGQFFQHNLFTTDPQPSPLFSFLFSAMGLIARSTHLPLAIVLHLTRLAGGFGLLWLAYRFIRACFPSDRIARLTSLGFLCFSSGFGWMQWAAWHDKNPSTAPIDAYQPEAFTFLSIYLTPLFAVSTLLILGALYSLLLSFRTGKMHYAAYAGLCGFILGNIHSYDVIHIAAAWGLFLVVWTLWKRGRNVARVWVHALLALALTMPTTFYTYYALKTDPVFAARANVPTHSLPIWHYALGYGLVFLLAAGAVMFVLYVRFVRKEARPVTSDSVIGDLRDDTFLGWSNGSTLLFVACWAVAGLCVIYLPFNFQRKMIMGEHIPLCLLAGWAASMITRSLAPRPRIAAAALLVLLTFPSNALFLVRDANHLQMNASETSQWPFLDANYVAAADWIDRNTPRGAGIAGLPIACLYLPGMTGRSVWAGHWGETPDYGARIQEFSQFANSDATDTDRRAFLAKTNAQYLMYPKDASKMNYTTREGRQRTFSDFAAAPPPYLIPVYANDGYVVFQINLSHG